MTLSGCLKPSRPTAEPFGIITPDLAPTPGPDCTTLPVLGPCRYAAPRPSKHGPDFVGILSRDYNRCQGGSQAESPEFFRLARDWRESDQAAGSAAGRSRGRTLPARGITTTRAMGSSSAIPTNTGV